MDKEYPATLPEAKARGYRYYVGKTCSRGHDSLRSTASRKCLACQTEDQRKWVKDNPETARNVGKSWRERNTEDVKRFRREWHLANLDHERQSSRDWKKKNPKQHSDLNQSAKALRRSAYDVGVSGSKVREWGRLQDKVCFYCGKECDSDYQIDHYFPLSKGGKHELDNLVISCPSCNYHKSNKEPSRFIQEMLEKVA